MRRFRVEGYYATPALPHRALTSRRGRSGACFARNAEPGQFFSRKKIELRATNDRNFKRCRGHPGEVAVSQCATRPPSSLCMMWRVWVTRMAKKLQLVPRSCWSICMLLLQQTDGQQLLSWPTVAFRRASVCGAAWCAGCQITPAGCFIHPAT